MVFGRDSIDISVSADYDGDNIADLAVRRPDTFTWYIRNSSGSNINSSRLDGIQRVVFGSNAEDIPAVVDYDGNGIADVAVRRSSNNTFYIENSTGTDFNSVREDDIQRILFGDLASYYPLAAEPYYLANAVMFASATTPGGDITIELPDGIVTYSESLDFISGDLQIYLSFEVNFDNKIADNGQISVLDGDENEWFVMSQGTMNFRDASLNVNVTFAQYVPINGPAVDADGEIQGTFTENGTQLNVPFQLSANSGANQFAGNFTLNTD